MNRHRHAFLALLSLLVLGLLPIAGCGAGALAYLKAHPPTELTCPQAQWEIEHQENDLVLWINGCGEIVRYVAHCNPNGLCVGETHVVVSRQLNRQAAFDLKCEDPIELLRLSRNTFGARGCGRQATYLLMDCGINECTIVQSTQSQ